MLISAVADGGMAANARQAIAFIIAVRDPVIDRRHDVLVAVTLSPFITS